jgi:hypothetical protein
MRNFLSSAALLIVLLSARTLKRFRLQHRMPVS